MWFIISIFAISGIIILGTDENGRPNIIFRVGILMILTVPLIIFAFCLTAAIADGSGSMQDPGPVMEIFLWIRKGPWY